MLGRMPDSYHRDSGGIRGDVPVTTRRGHLGLRPGVRVKWEPPGEGFDLRGRVAYVDVDLQQAFVIEDGMAFGQYHRFVELKLERE